MEIKDFEPNTHKYRESQKEERRVQKVVDGPVKTKKKSEATKFVETFISEDVHKVKEYIWLDVLVPAVKKAISDIIKNGIDMLLYGSTGRSRDSIAGKISYSGYYNVLSDFNTCIFISPRFPADRAGICTNPKMTFTTFL